MLRDVAALIASSAAAASTFFLSLREGRGRDMMGVVGIVANDEDDTFLMLLLFLF